MTTVFYARYDSRNFFFEGFGATAAEARATLMEALARHAKEYQLPHPTDWYYPEDIAVRAVTLGTPYRDTEEVAK